MKIFQSPASQNEPRTSRPPACGSKHECSTPRRTCACRRVSGKTFCTLEIPWKFERQKVKGSKLAGLQALHYLKPPKLMWTARTGWMTTASRHAERLKQLSACLQHFASSFSSITVWISKTQSKKMSLSNCWFVKLKTNATCKLCCLYICSLSPTCTLWLLGRCLSIHIVARDSLGLKSFARSWNPLKLQAETATRMLSGSSRLFNNSKLRILRRKTSLV